MNFQDEDNVDGFVAMHKTHLATKYSQNLKVLISIKPNSPMLNKWNQFKLYLQSQGFKF